MDKQRYMISDAAALVNVESHVLRYWEEELTYGTPQRNGTPLLYKRKH